MKPCSVPDAALRDKDSVEMLRAWIAEGGLHCAINIGMYEKHEAPEQIAWGIILSDVARHVANAMHARYGDSVDGSLTQIRDAFLRELNMPTSAAKGGFAP
ncbi:MAG: DUF5076 domain-containing protein, partial [Rhodospirillaceae bacterium]|nr:DUF5076 domain-containing protein [Rhodospirillaceae bacterium]